MTQQSGSLEQRLREVIEPNTGAGKPFYALLRWPAPALVEETKKDGEAKVPCPVPPGCVCLLWKLEETDVFRFLQGDKNADGALLLFRPDGRTEAHIIECKKKVTQGKWGDILEQMRWTLYKLLALAGVLGIQIDDVVVATAYRVDDLSEQESPNPTLGKPALGTPEEPAVEADAPNTARLLQIAWERDVIQLRGFEGSFRHLKIPLDPSTGHALAPYGFPAP